MAARRIGLGSIGLTLALATAACGGDKTKDEEESAGTKRPDAAAMSPDAFRQKQQAFADSVLNASSSTKTVVDKLGKGYAVVVDIDLARELFAGAEPYGRRDRQAVAAIVAADGGYQIDADRLGHG